MPVGDAVLGAPFLDGLGTRMGKLGTLSAADAAVRRAP